MAETRERRWAYKVGFLQKLAEIGVKPDDFFGHVKKAILDPTDIGTSAVKSTGDIGMALLGGLGSGLMTAGKGLGYTALGAPVVLGAGSGALTAALNAVATRFAPDLVFISAGFDAAAGDMLGGLQLQPQTYAAATEAIAAFAGGFGHQRIVSALEGGYDLDQLGACGRAHFEALP